MSLVAYPVFSDLTLTVVNQRSTLGSKIHGAIKLLVIARLPCSFRQAETSLMCLRNEDIGSCCDFEVVEPYFRLVRFFKFLKGLSVPLQALRSWHHSHVEMWALCTRR